MIKIVVELHCELRKPPQKIIKFVKNLKLVWLTKPDIASHSKTRN
jgi:hypothetical protein